MIASAPAILIKYWKATGHILKLGIFACSRKCEHQKWTLTFNMLLRVIKEEQVRRYCKPPFPPCTNICQDFMVKKAWKWHLPPEILVLERIKSYRLGAVTFFKDDHFGKKDSLIWEYLKYTVAKYYLISANSHFEHCCPSLVFTWQNLTRCWHRYVLHMKMLVRQDWEKIKTRYKI